MIDAPELLGEVAAARAALADVVPAFATAPLVVALQAPPTAAG